MRDGEAHSHLQSSSISSFTPISPWTPCRKLLSELTNDALQTTPTVAHIHCGENCMDVDCNKVQDIQEWVDALYMWKVETGQTVMSSIHNPASQMETSPTGPDMKVAESIMNPCPPPVMIQTLTLTTWLLLRCGLPTRLL